jgi:hypothetical protein
MNQWRALVLAVLAVLTLQRATGSEEGRWLKLAQDRVQW